MTDSQSLRRFISSPNNRCFACGPGNPRGLHLHFQEEDGAIVARVSLDDWVEGWEGVVHGGILATVLDEAMAYALYFRGWTAMTARLEIRYRSPASAGEILTVRADIVYERGRVVDVEARIVSGDRTVAEAAARFMRTGTLDVGAVAGEATTAAGEPVAPTQ